MNTSKKVTAVLVGAGHRGIGYASYALLNPDELKITGVVDPNPVRRQEVAGLHKIPDKNCFSSLEDFLSMPPIADAVINATMDKLHIPTAIPILEAGYDMLLEKPISTNEEDLFLLRLLPKKPGARL